MSFDRDEDWEPHVKETCNERVRNAAPNLQELRRAALSIEQVTGDEHWDLFLSMVKARIEEKAAERDKAVEVLKNSDDFTIEPLINQKLAARLFGREVEVLEWVIEQPKIIMEKGERAKELLETVDETTH